MPLFKWNRPYSHQLSTLPNSFKAILKLAASNLIYLYYWDTMSILGRTGPSVTNFQIQPIISKNPNLPSSTIWTLILIKPKPCLLCRLAPLITHIKAGDQKDFQKFYFYSSTSHSFRFLEDCRFTQLAKWTSNDCNRFQFPRDSSDNIWYYFSWNWDYDVNHDGTVPLIKL